MKTLILATTILIGGTVMALTEKETALCSVAACAAIGNVKPQLDAHIAIAQHNGVSADDIAAILAVATTE